MLALSPSGRPAGIDHGRLHGREGAPLAPEARRPRGRRERPPPGPHRSGSLPAPRRAWAPSERGRAPDLGPRRPREGLQDGDLALRSRHRGLGGRDGPPSRRPRGGRLGSNVGDGTRLEGAPWPRLPREGPRTPVGPPSSRRTGRGAIGLRQRPRAPLYFRGWESEGPEGPKAPALIRVLMPWQLPSLGQRCHRNSPPFRLGRI